MAVFWLGGCASPTDSTAPVYNGDSQGGGEDYVPTIHTGIRVGNEAPGFTLSDTYGQDVTLSSLRGEPVLLFFWFISCPACEQEYPRIQSLLEQYGGEMAVLSVNLGDDPQVINAYLAEGGYTFPVLVADASMQADYDAYLVPNAIILDAEGLVTFNDHSAYITDSTIQNAFAEE